MGSMIKQVEVLRAACCIAGLDKEIDDRERAMLEVMADEVGVGKASLNAMIDRALRDQNFYQQQFRVISADPEETMQTLIDIAAADHVLTTEERVILGHFAEYLGMTTERFDEVIEKAIATRRLK